MKIHPLALSNIHTSTQPNLSFQTRCLFFYLRRAKVSHRMCLSPTSLSFFFFRHLGSIFPLLPVKMPSQRLKTRWLMSFVCLSSACLDAALSAMEIWMSWTPSGVLFCSPLLSYSGTKNISDSRNTLSFQLSNAQASITVYHFLFTRKKSILMFVCELMLPSLLGIGCVGPFYERNIWGPMTECCSAQDEVELKLL